MASIYYNFFRYIYPRTHLTLTRGYKVVIGSQDLEMLSSDSLNDKEFKRGGGFNFSLFYFGGSKDTNDKYKPCSQAPNMPTKTAFIVFDSERHFGEFGGNYPYPSVT